MIQPGLESNRSSNPTESWTKLELEPNRRSNPSKTWTQPELHPKRSSNPTGSLTQPELKHNRSSNPTGARAKSIVYMYQMKYKYKNWMSRCSWIALWLNKIFTSVNPMPIKAHTSLALALIASISLIVGLLVYLM